jgi:hypothetical protein
LLDSAAHCGLSSPTKLAFFGLPVPRFQHNREACLPDRVPGFQLPPVI